MKKKAGMMNTDRVRESCNIDHRCDDGFWRFGYGNDTKRRRLIRHVEKQKVIKEIEKEIQCDS